MVSFSAISSMIGTGSIASILVNAALRRCPQGGHIYLHELLLSDTRDNPLMTASYSMATALFYGNVLFSAGELDELLRECGFEDISVTHTYGYYSLVSGRKP